MNKENPIFKKAFQYMVGGYSVLPLKKDKKPILASWKQFQEKPANDAQVTKWWEKFPDANVGIITGKISGITVVDIDVSPDSKTTPLKTFPETFTVRTPSGGFQLYYEYCPDIQQTANTFAHLPHVDIRNDGGYVVAAPSQAEYTKHGEKIKGTYKIVKEIPLAPFPLEIFTKGKKASSSKIDTILSGMNMLAEGDGRNNEMAKLTGILLKIFPKSQWDAVALPLILGANKNFKKPLEEKEVRTTYESIKKKEGKKPLRDIEFIKTYKGEVIVNEENIYRIIKSDAALSGMFRSNTFNGSVESIFERDQWEAIQKVDIINVQTYLMRTYPDYARVSLSMVDSAIAKYVSTNRVSPPAEWMRSLVWDKEPRLDSWLSKTYGTPDTVYHRAVASNWFKGMVKRIINPGSKFDYVLVLEGEQGIGKSSSLGVLGGDWHLETVFAPNNKDFFQLLTGNMIVEFSEGETLTRSESKLLKAVITMQHDKYRPPYDRSVQNFPRQCVFAMTTNQDQYLKDETGNRRWLPVKCEQKADIEWLRANREQLFAEAYFRVIVEKETTYEFPMEETKAEQEMRQIADPREDVVWGWYYHALTDEERAEGITTRMAYFGAIKGGWQGAGDSWQTGGDMPHIESIMIGNVFRNYLKLERKRSMVEGERMYRYYPTPQSESFKPEKKSKPVPLTTKKIKDDF